MAGPISGRVTALAVDPSDPSHPGELFHFNLDLAVDRAEDDAFVFTDAQKAASPYSETSLPAVQFEPALDDVVYAQPVVFSHDISYDNSFQCIPATMPF